MPASSRTASSSSPWRSPVGLPGLMAVNEILGVQHRLVLEFAGGAGFVGIAVALMGRSHPVGVVLAALLFGLLYQGGTELSFAKPVITRDMIVVIQGLVILFMGALEHAFRPAARSPLFVEGGGLSHGPVAASRNPRLGHPALGPSDFACLAGLWSERSGIVDIGLEGKMLAAAFAAAAAAPVSGSAWIGLLLAHSRLASALRSSTATPRSPIAATRSSPASRSTCSPPA